MAKSKESPRDMFVKLQAEVNAKVLENARNVRFVTAARLAECNVFVIGEPGVAKTMLGETLLALIEPGFFFLQFSPDTRLEEWLGPLDISALTQEKPSRYVHNTAGYLPSHTQFVADEIGKAGGPNLNPLLRALQESRMKQNGVDVPVPLQFTFSASNEMLAEGLEAIFDRLPLRLVARAMEKRESYMTLMKRATIRSNRQHASALTPIVTQSQLKRAQEELEDVDIPERIADGIFEVYRTAKEKGSSISPRALEAAVNLVRALAWLDGSDVVKRKHAAEILPSVLAFDPRKDTPAMTLLVSEILAPGLKRAQNLFDAIVKRVDEYKANHGAAAKRIDMDVCRDINDAIEATLSELRTMLDSAEDTDDKESITEIGLSMRSLQTEWKEFNASLVAKLKLGV